jgi:hypothetical protein
MQGVGTMSDDHPDCTLGERLAGGLQHAIPMPWTDVVRPHASEVHSAYARDAAQLWHRVEQFVGSEAGAYCTSAVVDLARDGSSCVDKVHQREGLVLLYLWFGLILYHGRLIEFFDRLDIGVRKRDVVTIDQFECH